MSSIPAEGGIEQEQLATLRRDLEQTCMDVASGGTDWLTLAVSFVLLLAFVFFAVRWYLGLAPW